MKYAQCLKLLLVISFIVGDVSFAESESSNGSYTVESDNGAYIFAMISPMNKEDEAARTHNKEHRESILKLRNQFEKSGMYTNEQSNYLLWTVAWYADEVEIGNNGSYLVVHRPVDPVMLGTEVLSFYKDGQLLASYSEDHLIQNGIDPQVVGNWTADDIYAKDSSFDIHNNYYFIDLEGSEFYIFDITTGLPHSGRRRGHTEPIEN